LTYHTYDFDLGIPKTLNFFLDFKFLIENQDLSGYCGPGRLSNPHYVFNAEGKAFRQALFIDSSVQ